MRLAAVVAGAFLGAAACATGGAAISQLRPGVFEVSGTDITWVHGLDVCASEVCDGLATLIELPERYATPVYVRITPPAPSGGGGFKLGMEPAGLVTLVISPGPDTTDSAVRHALSRALLLRHAAWLGGFARDLEIPEWLEEAGVAASLVTNRPSMLEALGREAERNGPIPIAALLGGDAAKTRPAWQANTWMLARFLRQELGAGAWNSFVRDSLRGGQDAAVAISKSIGRDGASPEHEWSAAFFDLAVRNGGPGQSPTESYRAVTRPARFVFRTVGRDTVFPWERLWFWRDSNTVRHEVEARSRQLAALAPIVHPFFVNAHASLQDALQALLEGDTAKWDITIATYEEELSRAVELTIRAGEVLDGGAGLR